MGAKWCCWQNLRPNCPVCSGGRWVESRGEEIHRTTGNREEIACRWQCSAVKCIHTDCLSCWGLHACVVTSLRCPHPSYLCVFRVYAGGCMRSDYSFTVYALAVILSPYHLHLLGAQEEGIYPQKHTCACLAPQATWLLCHSLGSSFRVCVIQVPASVLQFPFVYCEGK